MGIIYTICFLFRVNNGIKEICLGEKLKGFRKGTLNGSGGKLKAGETYKDCAIRETTEEFGIKVLDIEKYGEVYFYDPGLTHECHVYVVKQWHGEPHKVYNSDTGEPEMDPHWYSIDAIPYERMGTTDKYWLKPLLAGGKFKASFRYDANDQMYDPKLEELLPEYNFE
ncbi:MAG: NUDIX domain-containing protein [candidate division WWE3 bacterium]|nr:NUDIX domain-containing protein [candidate division WWE3 bacterium]